MKSPSVLSALCIALLASPGAGWAQAIYKSVDGQGNVTYSNTPPPAAVGVEPVTVERDTQAQGRSQAQPVPQQPEGQDALAQQKRAEQKQRAGQQAAAVSEAEKRLRAARDGLEAAKRQWDEDRRTPDRDSRVDNQAYRDHVTEEQRKVVAAEQALEAAKAGKLPSEGSAQP
jgi:Domain of unknown function (DUF4124)